MANKMGARVEHGQRRRLGDLSPHPKNSRLHSEEQVSQIAASMTEWDWTIPMLVDEAGVILAGHGRREAGLKKFGPDYEVPVSVAIDWTDEQKRAYVIADNRITELATWDAPMLKAELIALDMSGFKLELMGFTQADLQTPRVANPDAEIEPPKKPVTVLGDVWALGNHRLICGDSTHHATVARVLAGAQPHLMVTDPPYGVQYDANWRNEPEKLNLKSASAFKGRKAAAGKVLNDDRSDWTETWKLFTGDTAYIWHGERQGADLVMHMRTVGFELRNEIVWAKDGLVISRGHYHPQHEQCSYMVRVGKTAKWTGDRKQSTLWFINRNRKNETGHSTQKPVECMKRPIENNSKKGDAVYEPFSGSGTTIIAAEMTGRRCYAIELSPAYVDVAVRRWQEFTGKKATNESGGTFEEVAAARKVSV